MVSTSALQKEAIPCILGVFFCEPLLTKLQDN